MPSSIPPTPAKALIWASKPPRLNPDIREAQKQAF